MAMIDLNFFKHMGLGALGVAALFGSVAGAQSLGKHNANAPVDFNAGRIEIQDRSDRVVLSGSVTVTQDRLSIRSDRMTIAYSNAGSIDVNRIDATGGVVVRQDDLTATGNVGIYDVDSRLVTLVGNVQITQGANRLNGGRVMIDLASGRTTINGTASGGGTPAAANGLPATSTSGRVTGRFTVPQKN